jgi:hypothetical protein
MTQPDRPTIKLPIRDFAKKIICDGHLFLSGKEGRQFYLMKPGMLVDPAFIKKHAPQNTIFDFEPLVDEKVRDEFKQLFKEFRYLQFEKDLRLKALEIVTLFQKSFSGSMHFLTFAQACYESFYGFNFELATRIHETDMLLFRKSLYAGSFAVLIGLTNDFYHPMMIKDFFNLAFSLDIGLCEENYTYYVAQACNQENQNPGSGQFWLRGQKASEAEQDVFFKHPEKGYNFIKSSGVLSFPELAEISLYQHELSAGGGFPRGVPKGMVSSWESVVILSDAMVEIRDDYEFEKDVVSFVLNFKNKKITELPVGKVYKKLCHCLEHFAGQMETGT